MAVPRPSDIITCPGYWTRSPGWTAASGLLGTELIWLPELRGSDTPATPHA